MLHSVSLTFAFCALSVLTGCAGNAAPGSSGTTTPNEIVVSGVHETKAGILASRPAAVVIGTVVNRRSAQWNTADGKPPPTGPPQSASAVIGFIYTPVDVRVERALLGPMTGGQVITVRVIGGVVGTDRFRSAEGATPDFFEEDRRVLLLLSREVTTPDRVTASTMNYGFRLDGDAATSADGQITLRLDEVQSRIDAMRSGKQ